MKYRMLCRFAPLLLTAGLFLQSETFAETTVPTVIIANPPWHPYFGEDLPRHGVAAEIISQAFRRSGYRTQYRTLPWARAKRGLKYGEYDALATAYYTEERARQHLYSEPYIGSEIRFYQKKGAGITWAKLDDLRPYVIGTVLDYAYSPTFDSADFLQKEPATSAVLNLRKLVAGRIDLLVMDRYALDYLVSNNPEFQAEIEPLAPSLHVSNVHMMFSKASNQVERKISAFNRGLASIQTDGTLQQIIDRHLHSWHGSGEQSAQNSRPLKARIPNRRDPQTAAPE